MNENYSHIVKILWSSSSCRKFRELSVNFVDGSCGAIRPLYPLYERGERVRYSLRASKHGQALGVAPGIWQWPWMMALGNCCLSLARRWTNVVRCSGVRVSLGWPWASSPPS